MNELEIKRVPFLGTELMAARDESGQIWAGVSYICNGIGLNKNEKDRQVKNVQADRVLKKGCVKFDAGVFDQNNQAVAIKLDFVPLWLAKISITPTMESENPELADRLEQYQLRAKDVLAAAFLPAVHKEPKSAMELLRLQSQAMFELDERVNALEDKLENQMTIDHGQQRELQKAVSRRVLDRAATVIPAWALDEQKPKFFASLYRDLKDRFGVPSYRDIRPADYPSAMAYVETWIEPAELRRKEG